MEIPADIAMAALKEIYFLYRQSLQVLLAILQRSNKGTSRRMKEYTDLMADFQADHTQGKCSVHESVQKKSAIKKFSDKSDDKVSGNFSVK